MSNNNVVSHAAALAAFNGITKKDDTVFNIPSKSSSTTNVRPGNLGTRGPRPSSILIPKLQTDKLSIDTDKKNNISSPSTPGKSAISKSPNEESYRTPIKNRESFNIQHNAGNEYFENMKTPSDSSKATICSRSTTAKEMINNVRNSIESLTTPIDTSKRRISQNYEPQEMLKNVRNSINSKAKSTQSNESNTRNQAMLNSIRDSIDSKKITNLISENSIGINTADELKRQNINDDSSFTLASNNKKLYLDNNSVISLESAFSEFTGTKESLVPSIIIINSHDERNNKNNYIENNGLSTEFPNSPSSIEDEDNNYSSEFNISVDQKPVCPEISPTYITSASLNSSNDEIRNEETKISTSGNENIADEPIKCKIKRKPPPTINDEEQKLFDSKFSKYEDYNSSNKEFHLNSSNKYSLDKDGATETRIGGKYFTNGQVSRKLPQFPDLNDKPKIEKNPLFRRYSKMKSTDKVNYAASHTEEDFPIETKIYQESSGISRSSTPHLQQPVQLKTTMRKTNKRKEKKMTFNEHKPWKNHVELSHITEQERKRYEGVWASNKGSYINRVVSVLVGVDYNSDISEVSINNAQEISRKAALLSANALKLDTSKLSDHLKFHNIESADITQLLHGVLVKRIWQRSKLPNETLEAIWNLVDFRKDGTLNKPEFLVGMWLIDQCLYGRKLPKIVDDVVWDSLGNIGVNIVIKKSSRR